MEPLMVLLKPEICFCCVIMLIIPAPPSPSYFAVGLVMTSTLLTCSAGIICKASAADPEKKVDSLHSKNDLLENEADSLELKLEEYDEKIVKLNSRIYVIKKQTQKQLDAVDLFGDDELEQFFAKRYGQYTDSIN